MIQIPGYRIERELGRGGMATVYLATQVSLGRKLALKVLAPQLAAQSGFRERFLREGQIAAQLRHRHIVAIHEVGYHDDHAFMALAWLERGALAEPKAPWEVRAALRVVREIASALDRAHQQGVIHRDVKLANILVDDDGSYVLSDFGIAQIVHDNTVVTREGATLGTPAYMAPEQWRHQVVDGRADLYSLGIVMYQLLIARLPYVGSDGWSLGALHQQAPVPALPPALEFLQPVLDRLLAKDPGERFSSGAALVAALAELSETPSPQLPAGSLQPAWKRHPLQAAALFVTASEDLPTAWWRRYARAVVAATLILALIAMARPWRQSPGIEDLVRGADTLASVAVLPCTSNVRLGAYRELGDTLAEELIHRLSRLGGLTVIARSSSFPLRDAGLSSSELGTRLGASHLLSCSIRRLPDGVRISAELVDTGPGSLSWSAEYDRASDELLEVVDDLAMGISERLLDQLAGPERALLIRHRTSSLTAIRLVEAARQGVTTGSIDVLREAQGMVDQAIALDPRYAGAVLMQAELVGREAELLQLHPRARQGQMRALIERSLRLDPDLASAHALRSRLRCADHDWQGCRADLDHALAWAPGLASVQAAAAEFHTTLGSRPRAVAHAQRRLQIEPEATSAWVALVSALVRADRASEALLVADRARARFPNRRRLGAARALALEAVGRCAEAVAESAPARVESAADAEQAALALSALACAGELQRVRSLLRDFERLRASGDPVGDLPFLAAHLALRQSAPALDALEAMALAADPALIEWMSSPLHGMSTLVAEERLSALQAQLQLPEAAMSWRLRP